MKRNLIIWWGFLQEIEWYKVVTFRIRMSEIISTLSNEIVCGRTGKNAMLIYGACYIWICLYRVKLYISYNIDYII